MRRVPKIAARVAAAQAHENYRGDFSGNPDRARPRRCPFVVWFRVATHGGGYGSRESIFGPARFKDDVYVRDRITTGEQSPVRVRYVGYRLQHISNGNTSTPNFGFESHTGVVGMPFFLR